MYKSGKIARSYELCYFEGWFVSVCEFGTIAESAPDKSISSHDQIAPGNGSESHISAENSARMPVLFQSPSKLKITSVCTGFVFIFKEKYFRLVWELNPGRLFFIHYTTQTNELVQVIVPRMMMVQYL